MTVSAILFGSIGTLVDTSELQRGAFNTAFAEAGLDWHWDCETYRVLLRQPGGRARVERYAAERGETVDADALHARKTAIFDREMAEGSVELRPGVAETIAFAREGGVALGFATSTSRDNVEAMFNATTGQLRAEFFAYIGDKSKVRAPKPAPDIYRNALDFLGFAAAQVVAIEDTLPCFRAARSAGLATVAFPNENAERDGYDDALAVVDCLDPSIFKRA